MNIVYAGVENPLVVAISGYPCSAIVLTTDNGIIKKTTCNQFVYKPEKVRATKVKVWVKKGNNLKFINEWLYSVLLFPNPVAILIITDDENRMRPWLKDTLYKSFVRATLSGIRAVSREINYDVPFRIISYSVKIKRGTTVLYDEKNI